MCVHIMGLGLKEKSDLFSPQLASRALLSSTLTHSPSTRTTSMCAVYKGFTRMMPLPDVLTTAVPDRAPLLSRGIIGTEGKAAE